MTKTFQLKTKALPAAGIYIMRSERIYLLAVCHPIGVNRHGPHKHNDWLSLELCVDGQPVIIDPGTYCYTGNMKMRRLFRSTAYHNTVVVDGEEQIPIHDSMFGLNNPKGKVTVLRWESDTRQDLLEAEHTGYTRLSSPIVHRRGFLLDKVNHQVEITDTFVGSGKHSLEWYFHLDVGLDCGIEGRDVLITKDKELVARIEFQGWTSKCQIGNGWVSRAYNQRRESRILHLKSELDLSQRAQFNLVFFPSDTTCR